MPLNILKNYGYTIVENQSIFFLKDYGILLNSINFFELSLVVLIVSFIVAIKNGARKITFEILAAIVFSILGMKMIRNLGIYSLVFIPVFAINLSYFRLPDWFKNKRLQIIGFIAFSILAILLTANVVNDNYYKKLAAAKGLA